MMPYLFVARTHGACAYTQIFKRQRERQATILSLVARVVAPCAFTPLDQVLYVIFLYFKIRIENSDVNSIELSI